MHMQMMADLSQVVHEDLPSLVLTARTPGEGHFLGKLAYAIPATPLGLLASPMPDRLAICDAEDVLSSERKLAIRFMVERAADVLNWAARNNVTIPDNLRADLTQVLWLGDMKFGIERPVLVEPEV